MDFSQRIKEHLSLVEEVNRLQERIEREREVKLAALPAEFGYVSVDSFIKALRAAARGEYKPARPARPAKSPAQAVSISAPDAPRGMHAAKVTPPAPVAPTAAPAAPAPTVASSPAPTPVAPSRPTGTSLDDPANFGLLPDLSVLERGPLAPSLHRERLAEALRFTTRVLHTPKVVAAVWREWRQFERRLSERLAETAV